MSKGTMRKRGQSWALKFDLPPDDSGKRRTRYRTFKGTKGEAEKELRRLLGEVDEGLDVDAGKLTVAAYLESWLEGHGPTVSAATRERYEALIRRHIVPSLGGVKLAKVTGLRLSAFYGEKIRDGLGAVTVRHVDRVMHMAFRDAVKGRLIPFNPVEHAKAPKIETRKRQPLTDDEYMAILGAAEGTHLKAPLVTILGTGLRRGELLALTWRNVDVEAGVLRVVQAIEETRAHGLRIKGPKTAAGRRRVDLPGFVVEVLRDHRHQQRQEHLAFGIGWTPDTLVFGDPLGRIWSPGAFTKAITRLAAGVGVKFSPHAGRHEHFSRLMAEGCNPRVAQLRAGHSSVATTLNIYSHASDALQKEAASQMDSAFEKIQAAGGKSGGKMQNHDNENIEKF